MGLDKGEKVVVMELKPSMMQHLDIQAEYNPPEVMDIVNNYSADQFSPQDWNRLQYFKGKALLTMEKKQMAEEIAKECIKNSIIHSDFYIIVRGHVLQAVTYYQTSSEDNIEPLLEMAMEYAMDSGDYELMIHALCAQQFWYRTKSQFDAATKLEPRILDLVKRVPVSNTTANSLGTIAALYVDMCKWDMAIKYFLLALEQAQTLSLNLYQLNILNNLGSALCRIGDFAKAETILRQGLALAKQSESRQKLFLFYSNLGNLKILENKHRDAITYYNKCMEILENVPNKPSLLLVDLYNNYSMCYGMLGETDQSMLYIDKAIVIASNCGLERDLVQIEINKTNLLVEMGKYEQALEIIKRGVKYYKKAKDWHQLIWVYRSMARVYHLQKEHKKCYETVRKLDVVTDEYLAAIQRTEVPSKPIQIKMELDTHKEYSYSTYGKTRVDTSQTFIGSSRAAQTIVNSALLAAQHQNTSVLILGESGTGKEIIAQIIHKNSLRRNQAFVPVNVGALSSSLVESELFGHTKGAYTGADTQTKGFFLQADRGTLFLDEITDMPFVVQSKLLRALESRKVTAVGSSKETSFDCRIISATSQDIRFKLSENQFRLDLFHRLNTIEIIIPPLRDRKEDIEPIFNHYVKLYATELNKGLPKIDSSLVNLLHDYSFPGNVRELKNIVERMYILSKRSSWDAELLCEINPYSFTAQNRTTNVELNEEDLIVKALIKAKGKQKEAALILNLSEATLSRRIVKYRLQQYTRKHK